MKIAYEKRKKSKRSQSDLWEEEEEEEEEEEQKEWKDPKQSVFLFKFYFYNMRFVNAISFISII